MLNVFGSGGAPPFGGPGGPAFPVLAATVAAIKITVRNTATAAAEIVDPNDIRTLWFI
jgi:hypothetical protein